jgi:Tfp pilus assembly PilM family ATPase
MSKYLLGIEIIGSQVKIAVIKKDKQLKLLKVDKLDLPLGDAAYAMVNDWVSKNFSHNDEILGAISVSESSIFLEKIRLPSIKKEQLDEALYWELSSITSFPISEAAYDWKISSDGSSSYALVTLAKSSYIENWVNLFEKAGIKIRLIEPASISFSRLAKIDFSKRTLSLVVEENSTDLVILENKIPIFSTSISISVSRSIEDRRKLKKEVVDEIAESAKKIVSYWEEKENKKIEQATITGYIANKYFGLASAINKFLGVPVVIARSKEINNFIHTGFNEISIEQNMVGIGGALALTDEKLILLNLLTYDRKKVFDKEKKEKDLIKKISGFLFINLGLILLLTLGILVLSFAKRSLNNKLNKTQDLVSQHPGQEVVDRVKQNNKTISQINTLLTSYENKSEKVNLISSLTPNGISLTSLEYLNSKEDQWTIKGVGGRDEIIAFYNKLSQSIKAKEIRMPLSNFNENDSNDFEIIILW